MELEEQLAHIKREYPEAWDYLHTSLEQELPKFDENDDVIEKEETKDESIY